jgi:hypothetical protein
MRVKLSYTVEAEDVLKEAAKIIGLSGEDLQQAVTLFTEVQKELTGENDESKIVNINRAQEMLEDFRKALLVMDRRFEEAMEIIHGYDDYLRSLRAEGPPPEVDQGVEQPMVYPDPDEPELFGAD